MSDGPAKYRFGPRETGGAIGGLGWGQAVSIAVGLLGLVLSLHAAPGIAGIVTGLLWAGGGAIAALATVGGRPPVAWLSITAGYAFRIGTGRVHSRSARPLAGASDPATSLPEGLPGLRILGFPSPAGEVGVIRHGPTWTAALAVEPEAFALLDPSDKERRLDRWGAVLSGVATAGSPVSRIQWVERTAAQSPDALARYLASAIALARDHRAVDSYRDLLVEAGAPARRHETFVCLQIDARRASRAIRQAGGGDHGGCTVLLRELRGLAERLAGAEVPVRGVLTPRLLAQAIRLGFDPDARNAIDAREAHDPASAGIAPASAGPMATEEEWRSFRTDGAIHSTYWIAEWPRIDVGPDFLMPLILTTAAWRTIAVTIEPLDPVRALRQAENARTSAGSDEELRSRFGFATTARRRRHHEALEDTEAETAAGHTGCRFSGYITVSARTPDDLETAMADVEHTAQMARLELRPMWGEQATAFTYTLPLCRGLR
ncbi:MAG: SCO6880 family protein [Thermoleophilia bacterium]